VEFFKSVITRAQPYAEALKNAVDEVVRKRPFFGVSRKNIPMTAPSAVRR